MEAYLDVAGIVALAREKRSMPSTGYGFLSENPALAPSVRGCRHSIYWAEPTVLDLLGDKRAARRLAREAGVPVVPGTETPVSNAKQAEKSSLAHEIGFPLIVKAAFGGGGRGMRVVEKAADFAGRLDEARREAKAAFGNDAVFLERFVRRAKHIEVQILGDSARQHSPSLRARLFGAAAASEGRGGRARRRARPGDSHGAGRCRGPRGARGRLLQRGHGRVSGGRRFGRFVALYRR